MAVERRQKDFVLDLGELVLGRVETFTELRKDAQFRLEAAFSQRVVDEDLNYEQQLAVRKEMVKIEKKRSFPDNKYIEALKKDIVEVRQLVKFQKVRTAYSDSWTDYKSGTISVDDYIITLDRQLSKVNDDTLRVELQRELSNARIAKRTSENNILNNRVVFAKDDGSEDLLNTVLGELKTTRAIESARGNDERVSFLDTKIASINKQLRESEIGRANLDIEFDAVKGGSNAVQKLKMLNEQSTQSDDNTPITVNGTRFNSAQEYWSFRRGAYLSGDGSGVFADFFGEMTSQFEDRINSTANVNPFGRIPTIVIDNILNDYASLESLPFMQPFIERLMNNRNGVVNFAVKLSADAILSSAKARLNWNDVDASLTELEQRFAINLTSYRAQASIDRSATEGGRVSGAVATAEARLLQRGITPNSPNFDSLLIDEVNTILGEGGFTAPEKTPAETTREEIETEKPAETAKVFERPKGFAEVFVDGGRFTGTGAEFERSFGFAPDDARVNIIDPDAARERGLVFKTQITEPEPIQPKEQEFFRPQNFAEIFVDGQHFKGTGAEFESQFGFAPDDDRVKVIPEEEARGKGFEFKIRISPPNAISYFSKIFNFPRKIINFKSIKKNLNQKYNP